MGKMIRLKARQSKLRLADGGSGFALAVAGGVAMIARMATQGISG